MTTPIASPIQLREVTPPGHDVSVWAAAVAAAPVVSRAQLAHHLGWTTDPDQLVVLSAHPDDETLGGGRLLSIWGRTGTVEAITATAGEACVDHVAHRPGGLAERRLREWSAALDALSVGTRRCLRLPDGQLAQRRTELAELISARLDQLGDPVALAAPWRHDPHPDHQACGRAAVAVAAERGLPLLEYPVWTTYWADPQLLTDTGASLLRLESDRRADEAHRRAAAAFVSQLEPLVDGFGPVVPRPMLRHHAEQLLIVTGAP